MKTVGYALITLGAVALVRGLWLMTPVAGWIGVAVVAYVAGYHLSRHDDGPGTGATGGDPSVQTEPITVPGRIEVAPASRLRPVRTGFPPPPPLAATTPGGEA